MNSRMVCVWCLLIYPKRYKTISVFLLFIVFHMIFVKFTGVDLLIPLPLCSLDRSPGRV